MNRWQLTDEIREKFVPILKEYLNKMDTIPEEDFEEQTYDLDLSDTGINPYQLWQLLEKEFGYEEVDIDENGWEQDFWIRIKRTDGKTFSNGSEHLTINCCGMTFEVKLGVYYE